MAQKIFTAIAPKYRIPSLKKYKNGWKVEFYYTKNDNLQRQTIRVEKVRKRFASCKEAENWIYENIINPLCVQLQNGWRPEEGELRLGEKPTTLSDLIQLYIDDAAEKHQAKRIGTTTLNCYINNCETMRKTMLAECGKLIDDIAIADLTPSQAEKYIMRVQLSREWSATSTNNYIRFCRMLFEFAVEANLIKTNPFKRVKLLRNEPKGKRLLTEQEKTTIYTHLLSSENNLPFLIFTQLVYADLIRPVEILRLQVKDIVCEDNHITVILPAEKTKNKKSRICEIPQSLQSLFKRYMQHINFSERKPSDYLFHKDFLPAEANEPLPSTYSSMYWRKMCKSLNLSDDCKLYGLRHSGIFDLLSVLPANSVRLHANHATLQQTLHYADHENEQTRHEIASKAPIYGKKVAR